MRSVSEAVAFNLNDAGKCHGRVQYLGLVQSKCAKQGQQLSHDRNFRWALAELGAKYQLLAMTLRVVLPLCSCRAVYLIACLLSPVQSYKGVLKNLPVNCSFSPRAKRLDLKIDIQEDDSSKGEAWRKASVGLLLQIVGQLGMISRPSGVSYDW
jgi:hypothetical protein